MKSPTPKTIFTTLALIGATGAALYLGSTAMADGIPQDSPMTYAGVLEDGGSPVNGTRNFRLTVWNDPASLEFEDMKCSTVTNNVSVDQGHFRIPLSNTCTSAVQDHSDLWIEVEVNGQVIGRTKLGAVPYAVEAERAASLTESAADLLVPPGTVIAFAGPVIPDGWLLADGSELVRDDFPRLFDAIGTAHGDGNGSSTFHLPDYRGVFLRGVDHGAGNDPDASNRPAANPGGNENDRVGSVQSDAIRQHNHNMAHTHSISHRHTAGTLTARLHILESGTIYSSTVNATSEARGGSWTPNRRVNGSSSTSLSDRNYGTRIQGSSSGATECPSGSGNSCRSGNSSITVTGQAQSQTGESRPVNAYVNYIIKY